MRWILLVLCLTGVAFGDGLIERIRARGKCREIRVRRCEVVVKFTDPDDALLFAKDLKGFIGE